MLKSGETIASVGKADNDKMFQQNVLIILSVINNNLAAITDNLKEIATKK